MKTMRATGLAVLLLGLLSTACVDQVVPVDPTHEENAAENLCTITATLESNATKTALNGLNVQWVAGDQIKLFNLSNLNGEVYTLSAGAGTSVGTFTGNALSGGGPFYAIYPATADVTLSMSSLVVTVPAVQEYQANSFGNGADMMWAKAQTIDELSFQHLGGVLKLTLKGSERIRKINLYTRGSDFLNGILTVNGLLSGTTTYTYAAAPGVNSGMMTLDCGTEGVLLTSEGKDFFFVLPPETMASGFQMEVIDTDGKAMIKNAKASEANKIARATIRPMPAVSYGASFNAGFLDVDVVAGAWSNVNAGTTLKELATIEENDTEVQFAVVPGTQKTLRLQNWTEGWAISLIPSTWSFGLGDNLTVSIKAIGSTPLQVANIPVTVVKQTNGRSWLQSQTYQLGLVLDASMVE